MKPSRIYTLLLVALAFVLVMGPSHVAESAYQPLPTGTGFFHITGGKQDNAARAVNLSNSDITGVTQVAHGGTALAALGSPLQVIRTNAAGTGTEWGTVSGGGGSPGGSNGEVQFNDSGSFGGATNVTAGSGYLAIGAAPASTGGFRLANDTPITYREVGNAADIPVLNIDGGNSLVIGGNTPYLSSTVSRSPAFYFQDIGGTVNRLTVAPDFIKAAIPIIGDTVLNSPFSVHGGFEFDFADDGDYTLPNTQYDLDWNEFTTGAWTTGHKVIYPMVLVKSLGYYKTVYNHSLFTMNIDNGQPATRNLTTGLAARCWFDETGVRFASGTFLP